VTTVIEGRGGCGCFGSEAGAGEERRGARLRRKKEEQEEGEERR